MNINCPWSSEQWCQHLWFSWKIHRSSRKSHRLNHRQANVELLQTDLFQQSFFLEDLRTDSRLYHSLSGVRWIPPVDIRDCFRCTFFFWLLFHEVYRFIRSSQIIRWSNGFQLFWGLWFMVSRYPLDLPPPSNSDILNFHWDSLLKI